MACSHHPSLPVGVAPPGTVVLPQRVTCPIRREPVLVYVTLLRFDHRVRRVWCGRARRGCGGACGRLMARRFRAA